MMESERGTIAFLGGAMVKNPKLILLTLVLCMGSFQGALGEESYADSFGESLSRLNIFRKELHEWDRAVRGFRYGHNFFWYGGLEQGTWRINGNVDPGEGEEAIAYSREFDTEAGFVAFQYTYHLPISGRFGYYLGSSMATTFSERSDQKDVFIRRTLVFPGISVGLSYNFSPAIRAYVGGDWQLVRFERFFERQLDNDLDPTKAYFNAQSLAGLGGVDLFLALRWAVRLHFERAFIQNSRVLESDGEVVGVNRKKRTERFALGIVYHLI